MHEEKDLLWTWLVADRQRIVDRDEWVLNGGKWIIFDTKARLVELAGRLSRHIEDGTFAGAKYWNADPGALCVYCLDREKEEAEKILDAAGAGRRRVWEYDYATGKNLSRPGTFLYSWSSKVTTILRSYGLLGSVRLLREILKGRGEK